MIRLGPACSLFANDQQIEFDRNDSGRIAGRDWVQMVKEWRC
jgi:hypothetical protein